VTLRLHGRIMLRQPSYAFKIYRPLHPYYLVDCKRTAIKNASYAILLIYS